MLKLRMAFKNGIQFNVIFQEEDEGGYSAFVPSLPGCISEGDTFEEAEKNIKDAISLYIQDFSQEDLKEASSSDKKYLVSNVIVPFTA